MSVDDERLQRALDELGQVAGGPVDWQASGDVERDLYQIEQLTAETRRVKASPGWESGVDVVGLGEGFEAAEPQPEDPARFSRRLLTCRNGITRSWRAAS